ncbi:ATP-binding protein [Enterococcus faecalis]
MTGTNYFEYLSQVHEIDERCEIHGTRLKVFKDFEPFCLACREERIREEEQKRFEQAFDRKKRRTTQEVLLKDSVYTDSTLQTACFENYHVKPGTEAEHAKEFAINQAREYYRLRLENNKSIDQEQEEEQQPAFTTVFSGPVGVGKSHLAMSILKKLNEYNDLTYSCLFFSLDQLLRRIRNSYDDESEYLTEARAVQLALDADYFVLDDLGAEVGSIETNKRATDFMIRVLNAIVDGRQGKGLIITTNLTNLQIQAIYGHRIYSRLFANSKNHLFIFNDKRQTPDYRLMGGEKNV